MARKNLEAHLAKLEAKLAALGAAKLLPVPRPGRPKKEPLSFDEARHAAAVSNRSTKARAGASGWSAERRLKQSQLAKKLRQEGIGGRQASHWMAKLNRVANGR